MVVRIFQQEISTGKIIKNWLVSSYFNSETAFRDCGHHGVCSGGSSILFAWAKNAPPTSLPPSVGFKFGGRTNVKYVVMQIHYSHPLPEGEKDFSGMDLQVTTEQYA